MVKMGEILIGKDVILKEKEEETKLLQLLPVKAQLGFSSLKEHFAQRGRGDQGIKRFLQSSKPHDTLKLEYTCIDVSKDFIALGCNFGIVFFFDRELCRLQRFISESKQVPIVCLKILSSQNFVATGQFNGALTIFNYGKDKDNNCKIILKCTIDGHHNAPVTCIQWTPDGTKLFSGDSEGNVAISVINMDDGQTHTVFICRENSPVTQLSLCHTALLVSTLRRSLIWPFNTKMPVQVGQQERKLHGNFGACFFPDIQQNMFNSTPLVYAARPGLRIWRATIEGKVSTTMIFKDLIAKGEPEMSTLNLASRSSENGPHLDPKQFGSLKTLSDSFLLSWQGSCVWVLDPKIGVTVGCHSNFGCVVDVATLGTEMFVLTKGDSSFIRKISLEISPQSPEIEVKEIDLTENHLIPRSGSVNQFEETDKFDRIIGDVKNTTAGFISVVKRNVVKTIEHIKNMDDSEEDKNSSNDSGSSDNSPRYMTQDETNVSRNINIITNNQPSSEMTRPTEVNSPCVLIPSPVHEKTEEVSTMNERKEEDNLLTPSQLNGNEVLNDESTNKFDVVIKHDLKEAPIPFHHISSKAFSSDIVFQGTSRKKPNVKRKSRKAILQNCDVELSEMKNEIIDAVAIEDVCNSEANNVQLLKSINIHDKNEDAKYKEKGNHEQLFDNSEEVSTQNEFSSKNEIDTENTEGEEPNNDSVVTENNEVTEKSEPKMTSVTCDSINETNAEANAKLLLNDSVLNENKMDHHNNEQNENYEVKEIDDNDDKNGEVDRDDQINSIKVDNTELLNDNQIEIPNKDDLSLSINSDQKNETTKFQIGDDEFSQNETPLENSISRLSDSLTVDISKQKNKSKKKMKKREPCKKIDGEAVERTHTRSSSSGCIYIDQDDTINSNVCWLDEDEEKIDLDQSPPHSPMNKEPSLFPAPQMNYASIYSQDTVSLSDMSFSEAEYSVDDILHENHHHAFQFDSLSVLSTNTHELNDIEDNCCHTPPINLDPSGGVELTDVMFLKKKAGSTKCSSCSSPSIFSLDGQPPSPHALAEKLSERLRLLADSWAEILAPNCGYVQSMTVTDTLVWCIDSHDHLFITPASSASVLWKKVDGKARQIAANQSGSIIWNVNRKKVASYRTNVKGNNPQGSDWESIENDILEIAVDDTCIWGIKTNGDIFIRNGVSPQKPYGTGSRNVRVASDLVHITSLSGMVWGLDIYNHVQIYQGDLSSLGGNEQAIQWLELPGITASYVSLGPKGVCWIIDKDGKIWFNLELSEDNIFGGKWYELSVGEYLVQDPTVLSTVVSFFKRGNDPKLLSGNDISGVWILGKHGSLHAARGHLLGTRWDLTVPIAMSSSTFWTCVSAQGSTGNGGFTWALQPNGDLHCFRPESQSFVVQPPPKTILKFISASTRSLWALTSNQDVYTRKGISEISPQGLKWTIVNMSSMGSERICSIACGVLAVWAVDYHGNIWFQMGREDTRQGVFSPAWLQVEGSPFDGCQFTKVAIGSNDTIVWAIDDKNNIYARKDVSESFLIGTGWEIVAGSGGKDITVSDNIVWALCPNGSIVCRFGISDKNFTGDYWKTVPGCFDQISVTADDELWGIDRQGQLYQRHTVHFFGTQATRKAPSYSQLFPTDDDWELI